MANILKVLKGPLSTANKKNRNGRIYSKELWENVLSSEYWKDMITNNTLCGEVVHPGERTESDAFEIDARNISHRISEAHFEGDKLMGTVEILDTEQGRNLLSLVNAGCIVGISARGMGDLDGDYVVPETYNFKTFDITMRPSDPNARLIPLEESEKIKLSIINESEESDTLISEAEFQVKTNKEFAILNNLKNMIIKASNSIKDPDVKAEKKDNNLVFTYKDSHASVLFAKVAKDSAESEPLAYNLYINKDLKAKESIKVNEINQSNVNNLFKNIVKQIKANAPKGTQLQLKLDNENK